MHELSIASSIVDIVTDHVAAAGGGRVRAVVLRIGRLAAVHSESLRFSFDLVRDGTLLDGAALRIVEVPVRIWCPGCEAEVELPGFRSLACPACGNRTGEIRAGRELEVESIELADADRVAGAGEDDA